MHYKTDEKRPPPVLALSEKCSSPDCTGSPGSYVANVTHYDYEWKHCSVLTLHDAEITPRARDWISHTCSVQTKLIQGRDNERVKNKSEYDVQAVILSYLYRSIYYC